MKYIPEKPPSESGTEKKLCEGLRKAQLLLESCVETVVISKLGSFEFPVAKRLGELWQFPSDHPPIAAKLTLGKCSINVASWNVLNRHYYKYIDADTQGLKGSQITTLHEEREAETRENVIIEKIQEMLLKTNIHILCLQECWPELVAELKAALGESLQFEMLCSGDEQDKNTEASHGESSDVLLHFPTIDAQSRALSKMPGIPNLLTQPVRIVVLVVLDSNIVRCWWVYLHCCHVVFVPAWLQVIVFDSKLSVLHVHHHAPFSENSKKAQIQSCRCFGG